jgi:hypothetical protein
MSHNFMSYDGSITASSRCLYDSNIGFEADFSKNGEVDGWEYFDGIHTYGCWNNFLFGTLYTDSAVIGKLNSFRPVASENFYTIRIVMKLNMVERVGDQVIPTHGRVMWRTLANPTWAPDKQYDFKINNDTEWHTYLINMTDSQWWQGDINDLRIYPISSHGRDGDEFYIRVIEILSIDKYKCLNVSCDYYTQYEHNCPGIGERGYCKSKALSAYVFEGTTHEYAKDKLYSVTKGVNDLILVNINDYGNENIVLEPFENYPGRRVAKLLSKEISKLDVGGYAECDVVYTDKGEFIIYSGTYAIDSVVTIEDTQLARDLNFYDNSGEFISTRYIGSYPASGFLPYSSFKIKTHLIHALLDSNEKTEFYFNPFMYNVEGGRKDWLSSGLGDPSKDVREGEGDEAGLINRYYDQISNAGKTIIDFTHPINASGRITKIYAGITLDQFGAGGWEQRGVYDRNRKSSQLSDARIMFFRPLKNGDIKVLPIELDINNRTIEAGKLYSAIQEYVDLDCDIFLNKGDLIGVYNANIYRSKSASGNEVDALYYQVKGKASGILELRQPIGQGSSGLLLYARSNQIQNRLSLNVDLGHRINISNMNIVGRSEEEGLVYNIARCLDVDWEVDLFGGDHTTGHIVRYRPLLKAFFNHPNIYYGKDCLNDGIKTVPDGLAADSFTVEYGKSYSSWEAAVHKKDGGKGVVVQGAKYFHVNGDSEWLAVYLQAERNSPFAVGDFEDDPIAFTLIFPFGKDKPINSTTIYFKERYNFRSFALSVYRGSYYTEGNADDKRFELLANRTDGTNTPWNKIILDGLAYTPDDEQRWANLSLYLAENPCMGRPIMQILSEEISFDGPMGGGSNAAYFDALGGMMYYAQGKILNNKQYIQATNIDWTIISYEWDTIRAKGFRLYCTNHQSTKICEFEVFCMVENIKSSLGGSVDIMYSDYGDYWWPAESKEVDNGLDSFIGDTPQYININIIPITEIALSDVTINVSYDDVFMGDKGCQYILLPTDTKIDAENAPQIISFKNIYDRPYDLYVDIASDELIDEGVAFFSVMNDEESITNPRIGADAYYRKHEDYLLLNYQKNVAINCPVYRLNNLLEGAHAWFSHDKEYSWKYWGQIVDGKNINFLNLPDAAITTINLPVLKRSQWWKIGFYDPRVITKVREVQVYYNEKEIEGIQFYHQKNQDAIATGNIDTAPHLQDDIVDGSYYLLTGNNYIGFKLPSAQEIDRIVIYHDYLLEYENSHDKAGIDSSTALCIHGVGDTYQTDSIVDVSYYEHNISIVGSGIYCDEGYESVYYDFVQDFSDCVPIIETFSGETPDPTLWVDLVGATISGSKLCITNSGIIGQAKTVPYYYNDFDVKVDLDIDNAYSGQGWGCYLEAFTDDSKVIRIGRTYNSSATHVFIGQSFGTNGWSNLFTKTTSSSTNLKLKLTRIGETTICYAWDSNNTWYTIGSSTVLGTSSVRFGLISDLTPLAFGKVTIGKFDNFESDKADANWGVNSDNLSYFTCASGIGPNGWGYLYDTAVGNSCDASGYKIPKIYDFQDQPLDEKFAFIFDFTFKANSFLSYTGVDDTRNDIGVAIGLLSRHVNNQSYFHTWQKYFTGAQIVLKRDNIGIGVRNDYAEGTDVYVALNTRATIYYCRFTSNGEGHYHCYIWTDDFDGLTKVADFGLDSSVTWQAYKVGIGSGCNNDGQFNSQVGRATGWVSDFNFQCDKISNNYILHNSSIKFSGFPKEKLLVSYANSSKCNVAKEGFYLDTKGFTFDFFIKFNSLPVNDGEKIILFKCWADAQPIVNNTVVTTPCSWVFTLERVSGGYRWRFYISSHNICRMTMDWAFYPDLHRWYHFYFYKMPYSSDHYYMCFLRNGHQVWSQSFSTTYLVDRSDLDIHIGENLSGWMEEIRISSDYTLGGNRHSNYSAYYYLVSKPVPTKQYERYYTMTIYDSSDNINYGVQMYVDVMFDNSYSYHEPFSIWSAQYYTYFAIDLGQRHDLEIVRSFPVDTSYNFSLTKNVIYSNKDTIDPGAAFSLTPGERELNTDFEGQNYDYPKNWTKMDTTKASSYLIDGKFCQVCSPSMGQEYSRAMANFYFDGDFDFYIDYDLGGSYPTNNIWEVIIQIDDTDNENNKVKFERCYKDGGNQYILWVRDNNTSWVKITAAWTNTSVGTMRMERSGSIFKVYAKDTELVFKDFILISVYQMKSTFCPMSQLNLYTLSGAPAYPHIKVWWDNFTVVKSAPIYSTFQDARWMKIKMLNGDGTTRTVVSAGVYSDVSTQSNAIGQYNNYWTSMGTACTSYANAENIALDATTSGSSYIGNMTPENATNGTIPEADFDKCWGSAEEANPYLLVYFNNIEPIFRFKIYHGYDSSDTRTIITDYKIQISTDGITFSTVFTVTDNTGFIRTHDLSSPVYAKVVRLYVDNYNSIDRFVWTGSDKGYNFWHGAVIREFEIYRYYGFTVVNSEDTPIIAIDLQQPFFIEAHSMIGIDTENLEIDWDNSDSNFAWSNSNLSDPHKVTFGDWGDAPGFSKWVVVKRNTAMHYPLVPDLQHPYRDTPDYLKHIIIQASPDEIGSKPNPIEYPWMWRSTVSDLSYDYNKITSGLVDRSLKISYPASTDAEHVRFIEGDHFGWDAVASWRDGMGLSFYIDDINNLDLEYGYFYLGGKDYTSKHYPVIHRWNMTTFSGVLGSGWNSVNLTFLYADDVIYTELDNITGRDPRRLYSINWGTVGFVFRGKGRPLQLNFEGIYIKRNHFQHECYPGQRGLYLHANDMMKLPLGEIDFHSGALEFWIRPDWNWDGTDRYYDFKYRTLFHFGNVYNDVFGAAVSSRGLEIYFGNVLDNFNISIVSGFNFSSIEKLFHMAFVFSNDGAGISSDGSTIRLYINNQLFAKSYTTWNINDDKHFNFMLGGQGLLVQKVQGFDFTSSAVDGVICRLKIHNYAKTDYSDYMGDPDNIVRSLLKPSKLIEISKDNVTYNKVGSLGLPFFFKDVPAGESVPIWVKVLLPKELTGAEKRTAQILGSWDIGV